MTPKCTRNRYKKSVLYQVDLFKTYKKVLVNRRDKD